MHKPDPRRWWTRALAGVAALLLAASLAPSVGAHTEGDLEQAVARLNELEQLINRTEDEVERISNELKSAGRATGAAQAELNIIEADLDASNDSLEQTKAELEALRARMHERARTVYKRGPIEFFELLLGSESFGDFAGRILYSARMAELDENVVNQMRKAEAELQEKVDAQEALKEKQAAEVSALRSRQNRLTNLFASQQAKIGQLASAKQEAIHIISELESQLAEEQLSGIRSAVGKGMPITFGEWARSFLSELGAPISQNNLVVVVAWQAQEYTRAKWNPLATSKPMPGATRFNSHGVRNYVSKAQGIEASILTLELPVRGYEPILQGLFASADPMTTGRAINRSRWCACGSHYVVGLIPSVQQYYGRYASR